MHKPGEREGYFRRIHFTRRTVDALVTSEHQRAWLCADCWGNSEMVLGGQVYCFWTMTRPCAVVKTR